MSVRKWMAGAAVALVAVLGLAVVGGGTAAPAKQQATPLKVALVTDIGGLNDKGFNALAYNGLKVAQRQYGVKGRVFISKSGADYVPNLSAGAKRLRPRDRGRLPHGRLDRPGREEVPEDEVRDHRRQRGRPQGQAEERPWHRLRRAGGRVPRRCRSCDHVQVRHDLVGRRSQDPARRRVHRRLPVLRQEGEAGHQDAQRLLAGLRRAGQVQVGCSRPDRSGL